MIRLTQTQAAVINTYGEIVKAMKRHCGGKIFSTEINYSDIIIQFNEKRLEWRFLESLGPITDKRNVSWVIGVDSGGTLFLKLSK